MNDNSTPIRKSVNRGGRATNGPTKSVNWGGRALSLLLALTLVLAFVPVLPSWADNDPPRAHPALLQLAEEHPDDVFMVIIQREVKNKDLKDDEPETAVVKAGGKVKKQLKMIESFSAELTGKEIEKLARHPKVRWISLDAPVVSTQTGGATVRDQFNTASYSNNDGSEAWSTNWIESGDDSGGSPTSGNISVEVDNCPDASSRCIEFDARSGLNHSIQRGVDLTSAASATLSFDYRLDNTGASYLLEASLDNGSTWTTLRTYATPASVVGETISLALYDGASVLIRFRLTDTDSAAHLYLDNVQVNYTRLHNAYVPALGANRLWNGLKLNGQGVNVAVVDSGIAKHADLQTSGSSRVVTSVNFSSASTPEDEYGHGTHVAGIIAGNGSTSAGGRMAVAPRAGLINVKVSGSNGSGTISDLIEGLQWINDNRKTYNIRVVNISLNSTVPESYHTSPLSAAVEILWFNGIVVVVSAGNNGTGSGPVTLYPPANDPFVITVGAVDDKGTPNKSDDVILSFSAYGITADGFAKPDLVAPGRNIISLLASTSAAVYTAHPTHRVDNYLFRMSGTSMAAPMVAGAVALLLQDEPGLTPDQVKYRLKATANTNWAGYDAAKAGAGYLNIHAAVRDTTTQSANTGLAVSQMLMTGSDPINSTVNWNSVNWNSVNWNSVNWNSVNWNSVNWNSVNWNSAVWDD